MHISKREAEAEAVRIAESFASTETAPDDGWMYRIIRARPDLMAGAYTRRKAIIKWGVIFERSHIDVGPVDGPAVVLVDIETKEARWS